MAGVIAVDENRALVHNFEWEGQAPGAQAVPTSEGTRQESLPEGQKRLDARQARLDNIGAPMMAISRKDALKRWKGLAPQVEEHLQKIADNPASRDIPHWTAEINHWITQMENMLPHAGDKTAAEWAARIAEWKVRLGG